VCDRRLATGQQRNGPTHLRSQPERASSSRSGFASVAAVIVLVVRSSRAAAVASLAATGARRASSSSSSSSRLQFGGRLPLAVHPAAEFRSRRRNNDPLGRIRRHRVGVEYRNSMTMMRNLTTRSRCRRRRRASGSSREWTQLRRSFLHLLRTAAATSRAGQPYSYNSTLSSQRTLLRLNAAAATATHSNGVAASTSHCCCSTFTSSSATAALLPLGLSLAAFKLTQGSVTNGTEADHDAPTWPPGSIKPTLQLFRDPLMLSVQIRLIFK
jgi:hypothetical protein